MEKQKKLFPSALIFFEKNILKNLATDELELKSLIC